MLFTTRAVLKELNLQKCMTDVCVCIILLGLVLWIWLEKRVYIIMRKSFECVFAYGRLTVVPRCSSAVDWTFSYFPSARYVHHPNPKMFRTTDGPTWKILTPGTPEGRPGLSDGSLIWNLRAVIWFPFPISSLFFLPSSLAVLSFFC